MAVINLKHNFVTPSVRFLRGHHFRTNVEGKMRARKLKYSIRFDARARTTLSLVSERVGGIGKNQLTGNLTN